MPRAAPIAAPIAAALAAAACAGCAPVEEAAPVLPASVSAERQCFQPSQIDGYSDAPDGPDGRERFTIRTGASDRWLFETFGGCRELDWTLRIGLDTRGKSSVCTGDTPMLLVPVRGSGHVEHCEVRLLGKVVER